jgi:hypothetical protein
MLRLLAVELQLGAARCGNGQDLVRTYARLDDARDEVRAWAMWAESDLARVVDLEGHLLSEEHGLSSPL